MTAEGKKCKKHIDMPLEHCHYCLVECREIGEKNLIAKVLEIIDEFKEGGDILTADGMRNRIKKRISEL